MIGLFTGGDSIGLSATIWLGYLLEAIQSSYFRVVATWNSLEVKKQCHMAKWRIICDGKCPTSDVQQFFWPNKGQFVIKQLSQLKMMRERGEKEKIYRLISSGQINGGYFISFPVKKRNMLPHFGLNSITSPSPQNSDGQTKKQLINFCLNSIASPSNFSTNFRWPKIASPSPRTSDGQMNN